MPRESDKPRVHVVGHRNPDTDSIAAAIGYAELKGAIDDSCEYVACRLGELNPQTSWALDRSGAELPMLLEHVLLRVEDVMRSSFPSVSHEESVRDAGQLMVSEGLELLPVVDDDGVLLGVLTEERLARRYVRESREASRLQSPTKVDEIVEGVAGEVLYAPEDHRAAGRVWVLAMDVSSLLRDVAEGDVAVVGDRPDAQLRAVETEVALLILSNDAEPCEGLLEAAEEHHTAVIRTSLDSYVAGRMVTLSTPCKALLDRDPLTARPDDLISDVQEEVKDVSYRGAVVVDGDRRPIGLVTRAELVRPRPRRVILVDHAEQAQAVQGIEHAEIVEILDHHHIGSIETKLPVTATFDPVGSTSTLVAERFRSHGVEPTRETATMLLAALLSDTVILNSPTTTDRDRVMAEDLGDLLGLDPVEFGSAMFKASSDLTRYTADELVQRDAKSYELPGGQTLAIAQVEVVGDGLADRDEELLQAVRDRCERDAHRIFALMVTDVVGKGTRLVVAGDVAAAERAFDTRAVDDVLDLPGVMSRKKQVAPRLLAAT